MARQMTATEVKARIFALLDDVSNGETIEITKHGRTVARLVPAHGPKLLRGRLLGVASTASKEDELYATGIRWDVE